MSGRLEEIPGEEAFPAYLESVIASFYERAGKVRLKSGKIASVTIGGTVSPAGGNFEEPVTQATLKVVGAFHGLSASGPTPASIRPSTPSTPGPNTGAWWIWTGWSRPAPSSSAATRSTR